MNIPSPLRWKKHLFGIWILTCREWLDEGHRHPHIAAIQPDGGMACIFRGPTSIDGEGHITGTNLTFAESERLTLREKFRDAERRLVEAGVLTKEQVAEIKTPAVVVY